MGHIKREISRLNREARGAKLAAKEAEDWFQTSKRSIREKAVANSPGKFMPGKIYVFRYENPVGKDTLPWWDENPVVLALDGANGNDFGINLNLLPKKVKIELLDFVYDRMETQIKIQTMGRLAENARLQPQLMLSYSGAKSFLERYGFDFALRQYVTNRKSSQAVVAYEHWSRIAICDFMDLNGTTVGAVRAYFRKHLGK